MWLGPAHSRPMTDTATKNTGYTLLTGLSSPAAHFPANSHREASLPQRTTHETHTVASQEQLKGTRALRKGRNHSKVTPARISDGDYWKTMCFQDQPLYPLKHALQIFTDASKEGWGAHLNEHTATWSLPENKLHINYLELKAVFVVLKEFQDLC